MKLSICIPTDNQQEPLALLLQSIQPELSETVEVIICDNCSHDQSELIARDFIKKAPRILYYKSPKKMTSLDHLVETMDLAKGEYCWLLQPGDLLNSGAIQTILNQLAQKPELAGLSVRAAQEKETPWPFLSPESSRSYQDAKRCLGDLFFYFKWTSAHLALRKPWLKALKKGKPLKEKALSFSLAQVILEKPNWAFLSTPLIQLIPEDASLPEFEKTALGCADNVALLLGAKSPLYFGVVNRMCKGPLAAGLKALRSRKEPLAEQALQKLFKKYWAVPAFWSHQLPTLLADHPLTQKAFSLYHRLRNKGPS
ncbi:MAG: GalNAc(5)-diNAcBac-PP-undecaprenol beta-1,3-glucosyltransferase [Chlamydiae bacterium]|nr:GalNAc(5)-diNAcBac-PP-undecaprenol beta-1,3-glucosyltransferase [Chlamydiota bacterium]